MNDPKAAFPLLASIASVILHEFDMKSIVVDVLGVIKNSWN